MPYSIRHQRLNKLIQQFFAEILERERDQIFPPEVLITVTEARLNEKKTVVTIFLSVTGHPKPKEIIDFFNQNAKYWRHRLAEKLRHHMRYMPEVRFKLDEGTARYFRIEELLQQDRQRQRPSSSEHADDQNNTGESGDQTD